MTGERDGEAVRVESGRISRPPPAKNGLDRTNSNLKSLLYNIGVEILRTRGL